MVRNLQGIIKEKNGGGHETRTRKAFPPDRFPSDSLTNSDILQQDILRSLFVHFYEIFSIFTDYVIIDIFKLWPHQHN